MVKLTMWLDNATTTAANMLARTGEGVDNASNITGKLLDDTVETY
jgi:hypothetical protein